MQIRRKPGEDVPTYAARVNRYAEDFAAASFGAEQSKCLLFLLGFDGTTDREVRTRLRNLMETDTAVTLEKIITESTRLINVKADTSLGSATSAPSGSIHKVSQQQTQPLRKAAVQGQEIPLITLWEGHLEEGAAITLLGLWKDAHVRRLRLQGQNVSGLQPSRAQIRILFGIQDLQP